MIGQACTRGKNFSRTAARFARFRWTKYAKWPLKIGQITSTNAEQAETYLQVNANQTGFSKMPNTIFSAYTTKKSQKPAKLLRTCQTAFFHAKPQGQISEIWH